MGRQLIIGRSLEQTGELVPQLMWLDPELQVQCLSLIQVEPTDVPLPPSSSYDTLLFTSQNAVRFFLQKGGTTTGKALLCIGPATAQALPTPPHFVSRFGHARGMAAELVAQLSDLSTRHLLYPTSALSELVLQQQLAPRVASFCTLPIYTTVPHPRIPTTLAPDYAVYYSPSAVTAWAERNNSRPTAVSIGPSTTNRLRQLGWTHIFQAKTPTNGAVFQTLKQLLKTSCIQKSE